VDNIPSILTLKATATGSKRTPDSIVGSSQPLGLENGQLVLIGVHEDDHAVAPPPPAPTPAAPNYNLKPNVRQVGAGSPDKNYSSVEQFLTALRQPSLEMLGSWQNDFSYYALYRLKRTC
jgi:hypothetical protein